jgi:formiminotetrahydrofolate cyclodeaminase
MASPRPNVDEPLGGAALAQAAAAAATALAGVARRSSSPGIAAQAECLRRRIDETAVRNVESYGQAIVARDAAADLPPEKRDWEIGRAFAAAAEQPLELAHAAADLAELAAEVAMVHAEPDVKADAVAVAALAAGAARGALALVAVNLTALPGDPRIQEAEVLAEAAAKSASRAAAAGA